MGSYAAKMKPLHGIKLFAVWERTKNGIGPRRAQQPVVHSSRFFGWFEKRLDISTILPLCECMCVCVPGWFVAQVYRIMVSFFSRHYTVHRAGRSVVQLVTSKPPDVET